MKKKRCLRTIHENRTTADELRIEEIRFRDLFSFLLAYISLNFSRLNSLNELKKLSLIYYIFMYRRKGSYPWFSSWSCSSCQVLTEFFLVLVRKPNGTTELKKINNLNFFCALFVSLIIPHHELAVYFLDYPSGAPNENIIQNHLNIALLNVF